MSQEKMINAATAMATTMFEEGFSCSECVSAVINEYYGGIIDHDTAIHLTSGFTQGIGSDECVCGALSGGVVAIGLVIDKKKVKWQKKTAITHASSHLVEIFKKEYGKVKCTLNEGNIMKHFTTRNGECLARTLFTVEKTIEVIDAMLNR